MHDELFFMLLKSFDRTTKFSYTALYVIFLQQLIKLYKVKNTSFRGLYEHGETSVDKVDGFKIKKI